MFEVLNSRGLPVDSLDKCKSMLMGIVFEKLDTGVAKEEIKELHKLWSNIYREIGLVNIKGDEILRFTATLNHSSPISQPLSEEDSLAQFRRICESEPTKAVEVTQEILQVTKILTQLSNNKRLEAVTEISYARLLSVSILSNRFLEKGDKEDVIRAWEKVTFRVFGLCDKDSRFSRGDFTRLAYDVYNTKMTKDKIMERLIKIGSKYSIDDAVKNLRQSDCYNNWTRELRYFLYQYEEYLSKNAGEQISLELWDKIWGSSPSTTIEHIHPQILCEPWRMKIDSKDDPDVIIETVHRLGNLTLLPPGFNSRIKNYSFETKKEQYRLSGLRIVQDLIKKDDWTLAEIEDREEEMIEFAKKHWG